MRSPLLASVLLLTTLAVPLSAQQSTATARTQVHAFQQQDHRLDRAYRRLRATLRHNPQAQADLRDDQRDWLQHRDFACSAAGPDTLACKTRETAKKASALEARLRR